MYQTVMEVKGMMCQNCERHACKAIEEVFPVREISADHDACRVQFLSEGKPDPEQLAEAIRGAGYQPGTVVTKEVS